MEDRGYMDDIPDGVLMGAVNDLLTAICNPELDDRHFMNEVRCAERAFVRKMEMLERYYNVAPGNFQSELEALDKFISERRRVRKEKMEGETPKEKL